MRLPDALLQELRHRWVSAVLVALSTAIAVAASVVFVLLGRAGKDETRILQRDIGLNVVILPAETPLSDYYARGYSESSIPADYVERLSEQAVANRLVPMLRRRTTAIVDGPDSVPQQMQVLLTGIGAEVFKQGKKKRAVFGKEPGPLEIIVGGEVADRLGVARGDSIAVAGERFQVTRTLTTAGSEEDVTVYANLETVQRVLHLEGRLNEIQAIECHCGEDVEDPLLRLREQLESLLPGTQVLRRTAIADARRAQRLSAERLVALATPAALVLAALLIGALAWQNTRERREEFGTLRALGISSPELAGFVLARTAILGMIGAVAGMAAGFSLASTLIPQIYRAAAEPTGFGSLLAGAIGSAPLCAAAAAFIPVAWAVSADPAEVLRGE